MASLSVGHRPTSRVGGAAGILAEDRRVELVLHERSLSLLHISSPCFSGRAGGGEYADGMPPSLRGNRLAS